MTVAVAWSGGKDSAITLHELLQDPDVTVDRVVTTINGDVDRVTIHGVRTGLVRAQADAAGLPLDVVALPGGLDGDGYAERMAALNDRLAREGVTEVAFADLHLEDVRAYREATLAGGPLEGRWPLWGEAPADVAQRFLEDPRFAATVCCVDPGQIDADLVGRPLDAGFLDALPSDADPCGENGEYHSFVRRAPCFDEPVDVAVGERVRRATEEGELVYVDLLPD